MGYDMYWVEKADPDALALYEQAHALWQASINERDAIPKEEHGNYTPEEITAGLMWNGAPGNASPRYRKAQIAQHVLYEEMCRAEIWYCRRNIWGMRTLREVMERLDMVRSDYSMDECPFPWPDAAWEKQDNEGELWDHYYEWSHGNWSPDVLAEWEHDSPDVMQVFREYKQAKDARLTWVPEECFKVILDGEEVIDETPHAIPIHKFGSNDDWIVTPTECSAALAKARRATDEQIQLIYKLAGADWDPLPSWQQWLTFIEGAASHGGFSVR